MSSRQRKAAFRIAILLFLLPLPQGRLCVGQTATATIQGKAVDPSGQVVTDASITLEKMGTGWSRTLLTRANGGYQFDLLAPGTYRLKGSKEGFADIMVEGLEATINQVIVFDVSFVLARGPAFSVKVEGEAPLIEATQSDLSSVVGEQRIDALPNSDRDFINYALLSPGTLPGRRGFGYDQLTEVGVGPRHMTDNAVNLDGASTVASHQGYQLSQFVPLGSVQEFEFLRNRYSAEFGGGSGGVANVVTKSGTNDVHGSVFAFIRDERFAAAGPFVPSGEKPPFRRGQFGATLGGPLRLNQTHYFLAYDGLRSDETLIVDTGGTLPGEDGPFPFTRNQDALLARVDHQLNPTHHISGRYNYGKYTDQNFSPFPMLARQGRIGTDHSLHSFLFAETWTASDRSINEFRFQYLDQELEIDSNSADPFEIRPSSLAGTPPVFPFGMSGQRFQMTDNFSHLLPQGRGSHHFKLGGEVHAVPVDESFSDFARGGFIFTTDQPFDPGEPTTYPVQSLFGGTNRIDRTSWQLGMYFSDDWSVRDNLTLNLGLRYDLETKSSNSDVPNSVPFLDSPRLDKNNWSPRLGLAYNPFTNTVRATIKRCVNSRGGEYPSGLT